MTESPCNMNCGECKQRCCHDCAYRDFNVDIETYAFRCDHPYPGFDGYEGDVLAFWCQHDQSIPNKTIYKRRFKRGYPTAPCADWRPRYPGNQVISKA